jgi:hypothetical protein
VIFFRGKSPDASIWKRFRSGIDGFSFVKEADYYSAHVVVNAERAVDLFHVLSEQLPPAVDLAIEDKRTGRSWRGEALPLPDVRDAIARLKAPLAVHGGVELAVYTAEDQLTLNPQLELFIYSRTDRWLYLLEGKGLQEQRTLRTKSWKFRSSTFAPAPELEEAVAAAADRLGLQPA